jgi:hypothetical protein
MIVAIFILIGMNMSSVSQSKWDLELVKIPVWDEGGPTAPILHEELLVELSNNYNSSSAKDTFQGREGNHFAVIATINQSHAEGITTATTTTTTSPNETTETNTTTTAATNGDTTTKIPTMSFCLLTKDDNDILPEWIAYHYHLWNLRTLIVAMDPTSTASPASILDSWKEHFSLDVTLWEDADYMPANFLQGNYGATDQKERHSIVNAFGLTNDTEIQSVMNHRYRQRQFYTQCIKHLSLSSSTATNTASNTAWIGHIDTDEFLAINPWWLYNTNDDRIRSNWITNLRPTAGIMMQVLEAEPRRACFQLPRLLFGSVDDNTATVSTINDSLPVNDDLWNRTRFESLRWKYHAPWDDSKSNGRPKTLLDWRVWKSDRWERPRSAVLKAVVSIHVPLRNERICPKPMSFDQTDLPVAIHHYLGSPERFFARQDPRRTKEVRTRSGKVQSTPHTASGRSSLIILLNVSCFLVVLLTCTCTLSDL